MLETKKNQELVESVKPKQKGGKQMEYITKDGVVLQAVHTLQFPGYPQFNIQDAFQTRELPWPSLSLFGMDNAFQRTFLIEECDTEIVGTALPSNLVVYEVLKTVHDRAVFKVLEEFMVVLTLSELQWTRTHPFFFKWLMKRELRHDYLGPFSALNTRRIYFLVKNAGGPEIVQLTPEWIPRLYNEQCVRYSLSSNRWNIPDSGQVMSEGDFVIVQLTIPH